MQKNKIEHDMVTGTRSLFDKYKIHLLIIILYTILTIIFTYPIAFSGDNIPGGGDAFFFLWDFWWFKTSILSFSNPYYTPFLFHPTGLDLAFSALTPFNALLSIPLQMIFGLTWSYNILCLLSFILAGYGTYLLVRYLTGDTGAAFVSGLIFMFCPYHFAHLLGHMNLLSIQWIPFFVLFYIKTIKERGPGNAILSGIFLTLNAMCDFNYVVYLLSFSVLYLCYRIYDDKRSIFNKTLLMRLGTAALTFAVLVFPFVLPMVLGMSTPGSGYVDVGGSEVYSADILGFFTPSLFNPVFANIVAPIYQNFTGNEAEYTVFAGFSVLLVSLLAVIKIKNNETKFWACIALIAFILCLGPKLHINGTITNIILPFKIMTVLPILSISRVPSRWDALVMLSLAILVGYGLKFYIDRANRRLFAGIRVQHIIIIVMSCVVLFEFLAIPYPTGGMNIPQFYYEIANDHNNYAIYEVPDIGYHLSFPEYMYYQTVHGKELVTGYTHVTENAMKFTENTPFINNLYFMYWDPKEPTLHNDILAQNITDVGSSILNYYGIQYVILHEKYMTSEELTFSKSLLNDSLGEEPIYYNDGSMYVYEIRHTPIKRFITLGDGWYTVQDWNGTPGRWCRSNATLLIYSPAEANVSLSFDAMSFYSPRNMQVYVNGNLVEAQQVTTSMYSYTIPLSLQKDNNTITFYSIEGNQRPCDIPSINNGDTRPLSFGFQNISIN